jgi:hypothetical protein
VVSVRQLTAGEIVFNSYVSQVSENDWLNKRAEVIGRGANIKNQRRLYRELPEATGALLQELRNRDRVVLG